MNDFHYCEMQKDALQHPQEESIDTDNIDFAFNEDSCNEGIDAIDNEFVNHEIPALLEVRSISKTYKKATSLGETVALYEPFFYKGECSILFADTNVGKSILAVQIGAEIARKGLKVIYFDLELSTSQFASRYTLNDGSRVEFPSNFLRAGVNYDAYEGGDIEEQFIESIKTAMITHKADVAIIDNITFLCLQSETGVEAGALMLRLSELKRTLNISLLVVAHTPKRELDQPLNQNSLAGSKRIANFADSIFAIGKSFVDENIRYIKQIKSRNGAIVYGDDSVLECRLEKNHNGLAFKPYSSGKELVHITRPKGVPSLDSSMVQEVNDLIAKGMSYRKTANYLGISLSKVQRCVAEKSKEKE